MAAVNIVLCADLNAIDVLAAAPPQAILLECQLGAAMRIQEHLRELPDVLLRIRRKSFVESMFQIDSRQFGHNGVECGVILGKQVLRQVHGSAITIAFEPGQQHFDIMAGV